MKKKIRHIHSVDIHSNISSWNFQNIWTKTVPTVLSWNLKLVPGWTTDWPDLVTWTFDLTFAHDLKYMLCLCICTSNLAALWVIREQVPADSEAPPPPQQKWRKTSTQRGGTADFLPHSFHATFIGSMLKSQNQLGARRPRAPHVPPPMPLSARVKNDTTALVIGVQNNVRTNQPFHSCVCRWEGLRTPLFHNDSEFNGTFSNPWCHWAALPHYLYISIPKSLSRTVLERKRSIFIQRPPSLLFNVSWKWSECFF